MSCQLTLQPPPDGFNHSLLNLLPKKPTFLPKDTRPISVPNTDNRLIASAIKNAIHDAVAEMIDPAQKAFIRGRQISDHVYDVTSSYYSHLQKEQQYFLLFVDFKKAYDNVDYLYLKAVLDRIEMPLWVTKSVSNLLTNLVNIPNLPLADDEK